MWASNINDGTVDSYDSTTGALLASFSMGSGPDGLAVGPGGDIYVAARGQTALTRFDPDTDTFVGLFVTSINALGINFGPDGNLYATTSANNVV